MTDDDLSMHPADDDAAEREAEDLFRRFCEEQARGPDLPTISLLMTHTNPPRPRPVVFNVMQLLERSPDLAGLVAWDEFAMKAVLLRQPPWGPTGPFEPRPWRDDDTTRLVAHFSTDHDMIVPSSTVHDGVMAHARDHGFHPLRDRLNALIWDGVPRLDRFLVEHYGAADTAYTRGVTRRWFISGVARVMNPGCKADCMLVLTGAQGLRKSHGFDLLSYGHFTDQLSNLSNKDAAQELHGNWIVEISELDAMRKAEVTETKAFLSRRIDKFRPPYGRVPEEFPRQCVFVGTTNQDDFLTDATGNRRFWPVPVTTRARIEQLEEVRDQIWAEAVAAFRAGERWWIDPDLDPELHDASLGMQQDHVATDVWLDDVEAVATRLASEKVWSGKSPSVSSAGVMSQLQIPIERRNKSAQDRIARVLRELGWDKVTRNGRVRWCPPDSWTATPMPPGWQATADLMG